MDNCERCAKLMAALRAADEIRHEMKAGVKNGNYDQLVDLVGKLKKPCMVAYSFPPQDDR